MYLLYCIMKTPLSPPEPDVAGLGGSPVFLTSCNGLSAALSELPPTPGLPGAKELLDYSRVIEDFHRRHGVIPVRYGSCFNDPSNVHDLLRQRMRQYLTLLDELAGNVEMGIRIIFRTDQNHISKTPSPISPSPRSDRATPDVLITPKKPPLPRREGIKGRGAEVSLINNPLQNSGLVAQKGSDYLTARKTYYTGVDQVSRRYTQAATYYGEVFSASCLRHTFEADEGKSLLSLYFLVPERQVERFRETFRSIEKGVEERILMSGPWPPYNFAKVQSSGFTVQG